MLDWNAAREAIRQAVIAATGCVSTSVVWDGSSDSGTWQAFPLIELEQRRVTAWDDSEEYTTGPDGNMVTTLSGPRSTRVQVKITSDNQDTNESVSVVAERLRTRLDRESIVEALRVAGIGIGASTDTVAASYKNTSGRVNSVAIIEIDFNLAQNDTDTEAPTDFIETITVVGSEPSFSVTVTKPHNPLAVSFPLSF
jgi:hypothetical protein